MVAFPECNNRFPTVIDMFPTDLFRFRHPIYPISFPSPNTNTKTKVVRSFSRPLSSLPPSAYHFFLSVLSPFFFFFPKPWTAWTQAPPPAATGAGGLSSVAVSDPGGLSLLVFKPLDLHMRYPQEGRRRWGSP
jgi:hypothetical protein